jgi:hypothetical protein
MMKTHYDVLGARPDDDAEALKKAYRIAAMANHPDHHAGDPEAAMRFKQVTAAYDILRDAQLRAAYDRQLEWQRQQQHRLPVHSKLTYTVSGIDLFIANALAAVSVTVLLIGGYVLFIQPTGTAVGKAENITAREYTARLGPPRDAPAATEEVCKRDAAQLARLRIDQSLDEVLEFEQELGCEKLRPQVLRLRESVAELGPPRETPEPVAAPEVPVAAVGPDVSTAPRMPVTSDARPAAANDSGERQPATPRPVPDLSWLTREICKRDAAQLARLRISQSRDEILKFEQELGCKKLRPQVIRLLESVAP